jgi:hypothetical protein
LGGRWRCAAGKLLVGGLGEWLADAGPERVVVVVGGRELATSGPAVGWLGLSISEQVRDGHTGEAGGRRCGDADQCTRG